jgi:hypothetical protein
VRFENEGSVYLNSLKDLSPGIEFANGGDVRWGSLTGGFFGNWEGNIEGVDGKSLLNKMIEDGLFEKGRR